MHCAWQNLKIHTLLDYTRKNACSVTAFNSTDIRSVQDNIATPVTAMMVTVCISTDVLYILVCSCSLQQSVPIRLIQPWQPNRLFQSDTVSSEQSVGDNSLIQLWYHTCIRPAGATGCNRSVAFFRVYVIANLVPRAFAAHAKPRSKVRKHT